MMRAATTDRLFMPLIGVLCVALFGCALFLHLFGGGRWRLFVLRLRVGDDGSNHNIHQRHQQQRTARQATFHEQAPGEYGG